jgi:phospholipid transport system substrate-binding protein
MERGVTKVLQRLVSSLIFLCIFLSASSGKAGQQDPAEVIKKFNDVLLECMKEGGELGYSGRYKLLEPVFRESFAVRFMVNVSAGKYWKKFSEKERDMLLRTYTEWSVATYAGRFKDYSGQRFEIVPGSKPVGDNVVVESKLIDSDGEETDFYYRMRKMEGIWRIVDIQIMGVSQLAVTRSQFVSVIGKKGFGGLISMLKGKTANYAKEKS